MEANEQQKGEFESVKTRLEEIAQAVADESLSLDDALDLYEEAVALGLKASDLLEVGIDVETAEPEAEGSPEAGTADASAFDADAANLPSTDADAGQVRQTGNIDEVLASSSSDAE